MLIQFQFSESQQSFHNKYPNEIFPEKSSEEWITLAETESEKASEFVYYMNRYRFNGNRITEEFCRAKWESFLSNRPVDSSKEFLLKHEKKVHS